MKISLRQAATPQRRLRPRVTIGPPRSSSGQHARRRFLGLAAGFAALPISRIARAQSYPARPVRIIVGFPPGDSPDVAARLISQWLSERLRQQFFVENRAGAAGNIATEAVVRAAPNGYTLLASAPPNAINATLYEHLNFNFVRDTVPIAGIMSTPLLMVVNPLFPATTVPAFIAYAKSNPGKINMASAGSLPIPGPDGRATTGMDRTARWTKADRSESIRARTRAHERRARRLSSISVARIVLHRHRAGSPKAPCRLAQVAPCKCGRVLMAAPGPGAQGFSVLD